MVSSYTSSTIMIAVESGSEHVGQWIKESRNIYEDYKKAFDIEPPRAGAIALMTDTENTGESVSVCYGSIRIHSSQSP